MHQTVHALDIDAHARRVEHDGDVGLVAIVERAQNVHV